MATSVQAADGGRAAAASAVQAAAAAKRLATMWYRWRVFASVNVVSDDVVSGTALPFVKRNERQDVGQDVGGQVGQDGRPAERRPGGRRAVHGWRKEKKEGVVRGARRERAQDRTLVRQGA
jgi:hypothetical protein